LLHFRAKNDEAAIREEQLQAAVADKERAIRHEVAQAVATLEARLNQIALAERRLEFLGDHREGLRRKAEVTPAATFEVRKATLAVLVAQQDLFHDVIEWKVAVVKLREAQGELAIECGYTDVFEYAANCCP
jgi:N-acyl-D-aspartate/D-glutamate deacylase